ncbi:MAG: family 20 glycosylhydrolase [Bacteroidales bacterium]|jgi:hexosaminidase|nr:family 20 glycosylhydrolase [Bacteroidales bacterium]MDD2205359.1 family 20 glycosylhydrolase [Bacteroidales bacterium]MDD3152491.1 family 20 glycosylhydrolase [Bacteroidales bacterium]MDD4634207.1 family 20 glycosylhydrolase [Bacteroidales bacterium]
MEKRFFILMLCYLVVNQVFAQNVIPYPKVCEYNVSGDFTEIKSVVVNGVERNALSYLIDDVTDNTDMTDFFDDIYTLSVKSGDVQITGREIRAYQTLKQLAVDNKLQDIYVADEPAYKFRTFMHDVGRNFQSIEMLKKDIDLMCFYKLNVFHWHLTDHPAWRIECKAYQQLNDPQYQRKGRDEGEFYSYDEIRDLIHYAKQCGVLVIPEIDMPGHSTYFNSTFGFSMDSDEGKVVLERCLKEFFDEIPKDICPYIHIGSDEIHIADPKGFMAWAEKIVKDSGRIAVAWDPGLPASETTIRQIWNAAEVANVNAVSKKGKYLDSFVGYLNYYDPILFTNRAFLHTACAQAVPDTSVALGGVLCLWNDVRVADKDKIALHNGLTNGMMAFAERFWRGGNAGFVEEPNILPNPNSEAGIALLEFENRMKYHRDFLLDRPVLWHPNAKTEWIISLQSGDTVSCIRAWGGAVDMEMLCKYNNISFDKTTAYPVEAWAETNIYSDKDTIINAWVGFEAPARSNRISNGIGKQGKWECDGRMFVNDEEIFPPLPWNEPEKYCYHFNTWLRPQEEEPYTDEQFYWMRQPVKINLKKGDNRIKLYVPKVFAGQRWTFAALFE